MQLQLKTGKAATAGGGGTAGVAEARAEAPSWAEALWREGASDDGWDTLVAWLLIRHAASSTFHSLRERRL
jgi:hypothetical protein